MADTVPGTPRIAEAGVVLAPFARADVARLVAWTPDARFLAQWAGPTLSFPLDAAQFEPLFAQDAAAPSALAWQLVDAAHGRALGHAELARVDRAAATGFVSRVLVGDPAARGRGVGGAAIRAIERVARERLGLRELTLNVFTWNAPAIACYEREGFEREDVHATLPVGDERWDVLRMRVRLDRAPAG
jgi:RimJ/RimL family protein N-acetyltransferase